MIYPPPKENRDGSKLEKTGGAATSASKLLLVVLSRRGGRVAASLLKIQGFWPFFPGGRLTQNESSQVIIAPIPLFNLVFFGWEGRWLVFYRFLRIFPWQIFWLILGGRKTRGKSENPILRAPKKKNLRSSKSPLPSGRGRTFSTLVLNLVKLPCNETNVRSVEPVVTHINLDWLSSQRPKQIEIQTSILSTACFQVDAYVYMYHTLRSIYESLKSTNGPSHA